MLQDTALFVRVTNILFILYILSKKPEQLRVFIQRESV